MEINFGGIADVFQRAGHTLSKEIFKYVPAALSKDKQFANAYAACIAILVIADRKVEVDETRAAIDFIKRSEVLKRIDCVTYALDFYAGFIAQFQPMFNNEPMLLVSIAKVIEEHVKICDKSYKPTLIQLISDLTNGNPNSSEIACRNELFAALA